VIITMININPSTILHAACLLQPHVYYIMLFICINNAIQRILTLAYNWYT